MNYYTVLWVIVSHSNTHKCTNVWETSRIPQLKLTFNQAWRWNKYKIEYPNNELDIIKLIKRANLENIKIRVVGSKHSFLNAIYYK